MPKQTLLELTQDVLSAVDGDEVNSISDTVESMQVVTLLKRSYLLLITEQDLPVNRKLTFLEGVADTDRPTHMLIPENVSKVLWVQYDVKSDNTLDNNYVDMIYLSPEEFVLKLRQNPTTDTTNYKVVNFDTNVDLAISKVGPPQYYTSFDDKYFVFNSFNSVVDSTLQTSKSMIYADYQPEFLIEDDFVPDLPENLFPQLYSMAEAKAFAIYKQQLNMDSEQEKNRLRIRSQRNKWRNHRHDYEGPDFGKR